MDTRDFYKELIKRYRDRTATDEELTVFFNLVREGKLDTLLAEDMDKSLESDIKQIRAEDERRPKIHLFIPYAAAIVLLFLAISIQQEWFTTSEYNTDNRLSSQTKNDVEAGKNKATLTLSDGRRIALESASIGEIKGEQRVKINKAKDGTLIYQSQTENPRSISLAYNEIRVPRGGQYQIILPDNSKVWLNADSYIRFPTVFSRENRSVFLAGEGFFEVTPGSQPFIVKTADQQVHVLGTRFNVKAYLEDRTTETTLLSGSVRVNLLDDASQTKLLKPNEQAIHNHLTQHIDVLKVEGKDFMSWKDGLFVFNNTSLEAVMKEVARWYNVEVTVDKIPQKHLYAVLPKSVNLSELLEMIALTSDVHFRIEGRRICL